MRLFLAMMLAAVGGTGSSSAAAGGVPEDVKSCAGNTIRTYGRDWDRGSPDRRVEITHGMEVAYERTGFSFLIGVRPNFPDSPPALIGQDLTASGAPHVVIYEWTGGAHCCIVAHVIRLGKTLQEIATIDGEHSDPEFRAAQPGQPWEVWVRDWTFAYWPASFASSPAPEVILRWDGRRYIVARARMQEPAPPRRQLAALAQKLRGDKAWSEDPPFVPPELYITALDLMYSGHEGLGWWFIQEALAPQYPQRGEFLSGLKSRLAASTYWQSLK